MLDRAELNRALSKAIAYKNVGKHIQAALWAVKLVELIGTTGILDLDYVRTLHLSETNT